MMYYFGCDDIGNGKNFIRVDDLVSADIHHVNCNWLTGVLANKIKFTSGNDI